jgi:hypothetical protein
MVGFINTLVTHTLLITLKYMQYSVIADLHTFQFTVAHALGFSVFLPSSPSNGSQHRNCHFKSLTHSLTWALLEKLPVVQPLKKFPALYANRRFITASQEPSTGPYPSQSNLIHPIPSYLSNIYFNIVHPTTSWSSQWSLSFWISHQYPILNK